ncbi:hypothetical protein EFM42_10550 [Levilactobacillus brevis]|uniref:O-antigen ligase family protein n=1 Tax=Levilactobacillus brevis TaxID=1580 RepID=UPI0004667AF3|nr:O-antigen ligase family protein [Levilactobacillus brevis]MCT2887839.1 hypothetical protein [Levilactobacillus brevis]QCZ46435.1 hypothetical protein UCCLB556_1552 [Levilactobacillus brevis]
MKIGLKSFLMTGLVLGLVLSMNTVYYAEVESKTPKYLILGMIFLFSTVLLILSVYKLFLLKKSLRSLILFYIFYLLLSVILVYSSLSVGHFGSSNLFMLVLFPILIAPTVYLERVINSVVLFKIYETIVVILSVVSLFFWGLAMIGFSTNMMRQISWGTVYPVNGFFNIHFLAQDSVSFFGMNLIRNTGLFVEAPMYSFILSIAVLSHLFITSTNKWMSVKLLIWGITIFTTTSTTGLLLFIFAVFVRFVMDLNGIKKILLMILVPVLLFVAVLVIRAKVQSMSGSVNIRLNDFYAGFQAWKEKPFFGHGISDISSIKNYMDISRTVIGGNDGFSSGFMEMLVGGGGFFAFFWGVVPFLKYGMTNKINASFAFLLFVLLMVTIVDKTYLFVYLLVFMIL